MKSLFQPVIGYLELGMFGEAKREIERLYPELKAARVRPAKDGGAWRPLREVAAILVSHWPGDVQNWMWLFYATRRCRSMAEAEKVLLDALKIHPLAAMLHYNIACCAAQSGKYQVARTHLALAVLLQPDLGPMAADDSELAPVWSVLAVE